MTTATTTSYCYLREAVEEAEGVDCVVQSDGEADCGGGGAAQAFHEHLAVIRRQPHRAEELAHGHGTWLG